jgi:hypothetical protein
VDPHAEIARLRAEVERLTQELAQERKLCPACGIDTNNPHLEGCALGNLVKAYESIQERNAELETVNAVLRSRIEFAEQLKAVAHELAEANGVSNWQYDRMFGVVEGHVFDARAFVKGLDKLIKLLKPPKAKP